MCYHYKRKGIRLTFLNLHTGSAASGGDRGNTSALKDTKG